MRFHRVNREIEQYGDLGERLIQNVLQNNHAALENRELGKARYRGPHRFLTHQLLHRIGVCLVDDIVCSLYRLGCSDSFAAQHIQCAVVGNPKKPSAKWGRFGQSIESDERFGKRVLHNVLALDHRTHETRTIAVKLRPQRSSQGDKLSPPLGV